MDTGIDRFRNCIEVVALHSMHAPGGCLVLNWSDNIPSKLKAIGINPDLSRFHAEFISCSTPVRDGYFTLAVIKIFNGEKNSLGGIGEFLENFARSEYRQRGIELNHDTPPEIRGNNIGFILIKRDDLVLMASTWIKNPKVG